jgi:small subunit ribosomal protein S16
MAVRIRLTRKGRKKQPFYRIIIADSEAARDGKFLDIVGTYDPMQDPAVVKIDNEKLGAWIQKGAKPTETVASLLKKHAAWSSFCCINERTD